MRALKCFLAALAAATVAGCAGYHLGPVNHEVAGGKTIEILPFNNQTLQPRLGDAVTESLREHLMTEGTFHLASSGGANVVVSGRIHDYNRAALGFLNSDASTPEDYRIEIVVH